MTYRSVNKKPGAYKKYIILGVIALLISFFWPSVKSGVYAVIEPLLVSEKDTSKSSFFGVYFSSKKALSDENALLLQKVEELETSLAEKDALIRIWSEVSSSSVFSFSQKPPIPAFPIIKDRTGMYGTVLLSKGFRDGVEVGNKVYVRGAEVVCVIEEVSQKTSLCKLLTAHGMRTEAVTASSSIVLTLQGRGGHYLADVVRDTPISVGEKVYLQEDQMLSVGTISEIYNNNQDTSWRVFIESAHNPTSASVFYVQQN